MTTARQIEKAVKFRRLYRRARLAGQRRKAGNEPVGTANSCQPAAVSGS